MVTATMCAKQKGASTLAAIVTFLNAGVLPDAPLRSLVLLALQSNHDTIIRQTVLLKKIMT
ncbi:hypothetical protein HU200_038357 [Digitaria exilis]|uniref:Uncharacterized protein n=1 Tax=Digitaria exilis TaxID=1010633 RepID=A0A835BCT6_9POAL|nr:hypothetical protein HU200_038357 [Digitaria exilis]